MFGSRALRNVAAITAVFLMAMAWLALCMSREISVYDEGLILLGAQRVLNGDVPHRDFYALYGPAQFYILAALYKLFGASVLIERAWDTVIRSGCVVFVFLLVRRTTPAWLALIAAGASLEWLRSFGSYGYPVFPALAAALAGLLFLLPDLGRSGPTLRLAAAGLCAGVATLFRYDVGVALFGTECLIVASAEWFRGDGGATRRILAALPGLIVFGLGFAIVTLPVAVSFTLHGVWPDLIFDVVTVPSRYYVRTRSLPFPALTSPRSPMREFAVYLPILICAAAVPTIVSIMRNQRAARKGPVWTLLTLTLLTPVFFAKGLVRVSPLHMSLALISSILLLGVMLPTWAERNAAGRILLALAVLATGVVTAPALPQAGYRLLGNLEWARNSTSWDPSPAGAPFWTWRCKVSPGLERAACLKVSPETAAAVQYVEAHTRPEDPLYVGLTRHDKIFINDMAFYFVANREPATKWHHFDPGLQTSAAIQQDMIGELRRTRPPVIVLESTWDDAAEPNESAIGSGVTLLDEYIKQTYETVATFGDNIILRPRAEEAPK